MKYAILTFGCRTNQADSFVLDRDLRAIGAEEVAPEAADFVVVNTCAVTAAAEQGARQAIRRVARLNPSARIIATGCYATREPGELRSLPVAMVLGNDAKSALASTGLTSLTLGPGLTPWRSSVSDVRQRSMGSVTSDLSPASMPGPGARGRTLYLLRVQAGCDERCSYCVVPFTRGPSRSVPPESVIREAQAAAAAGFAEATITGVHLGSYGRDLRSSLNLAVLLDLLCSQTTGVRFRVSAVEPMDFTDNLIRLLEVRDDRFARHFHLPLQHASDRILSSMLRPYTLAAYREILDRLLDAVPDASVGTDLLVGFPGESEADFEQCLAFLETSRLSYAHVFPFSARPGTAAARLGGRPRNEDVKRRVRRLRAAASDLGRRFRARFVGCVRDGLTIEDGTLVLTDNYLRVRIAPGLPRNMRVQVKIEADGEPTMTGVIVRAGSRAAGPATASDLPR